MLLKYKKHSGWEKVYFPTIGMSFTQLLKTVGWHKYDAWCALAGEAIWKLGYSQYDSTMIKTLDNLFSASAVQTWRNFLASDFVCSQTPEVGALIIWQNYANGIAKRDGHLGIVLDFSETLVKTEEGNSANQMRKRLYKFPFIKKENGLNLLGFVHPKL